MGKEALLTTTVWHKARKVRPHTRKVRPGANLIKVLWAYLGS